MSKKQRRNGNNGGFTLVEILIVIVIIGVMAGLGFVSYFNFMDRQRVRSGAMEAQTFLRDIQNRAKMGDRGGGACSASNGGAAGVLNRVFCGWEVAAVNNSSRLEAAPFCLPIGNQDISACASANVRGDAIVYDLAQGILATTPRIIFPSLYNNVQAGTGGTIILRDPNTETLPQYSLQVSTDGGINVVEKTN